MRTLFLFILLVVTAQKIDAQTTGEQVEKTVMLGLGSTNAKHFVSCYIENVLYFSLEDNPEPSTGGERKLVINSNIPFNITVNESYQQLSYSYMNDLTLPDEKGKGPSVAQITAVKKIEYFRDVTYKSLTSLLYTAAAL